MEEPMLQFFEYAHLPKELQSVSYPFCELAREIVQNLPRNPERTVALRKLLESKDCAVRAKLYKDANRDTKPIKYPMPTMDPYNLVHGG